VPGDFFEYFLEGAGDATGEVGVCGTGVDDGALAFVELPGVNIDGGGPDFDVFESDGVPAGGFCQREPLQGRGVVSCFVAACEERREGGRDGEMGEWRSYHFPPNY